MRTEWEAHYLDGQTAVRQPAAVRLMREGLEVTTAGGWTRLWPYREIRQTQGFYEGEEVRLERGGALPEALIISDAAFLQSLHQAAPHMSSRFHDPADRGRRLRLVIVAGGAIIAITATLYLWGIPLLAAFVAPRVPVAWEESLGRAVVDQLAPAGQRCVDPRRQPALDAIVTRLVAAAPPSPYTFRLVVVDRPQVNALAAPGGHIVVFSGLLVRTRTPDELAGVLAHEIQHVLHRHTTRALVQHTSTGLLLAALTGDMTGPLAYALEGARVLGQLQYSRHAEEEADWEGMRLLLAARVAPAGMLAFLDDIATEGQPRSARAYLSTHPHTRERIARLRELAAGAGAPPVPLLPDQDWSDVKKLCSSASSP